jgi:signal transduction histidine kinase
VAGCLAVIWTVDPPIGLCEQEGVQSFLAGDCQRFGQQVRQIAPDVLLLAGAGEGCQQMIRTYREAIRWGYVVALVSAAVATNMDPNLHVDEVWVTEDAGLIHSRLQVLCQLAQHNRRWQMMPQQVAAEAISQGQLTLVCEGNLLSPTRAAQRLLGMEGQLQVATACSRPGQADYPPLLICGVQFPWPVATTMVPWRATEAASVYQAQADHPLPEGEMGGRFEWGRLLSECISREYHLQLERMRNRMLRQQAEQTSVQISKQGRLAVAGELAAGIAHEIRNPLAAVRGFIQLLRQRLVRADLSIEIRYADYVLEEIDRANQILSDFLAMTRPSKEEKQLIDLTCLLTQQIELVRHQALLTGVELTVDLPKQVPAIRGRAEAVKQVFLNLLSNALQATAEGGSVELVCSQLPGQVQVDVRDTGSGIDPEQIPHIFEPFYTTKEEGTGLGLSICREIVTDHGGSIEVVSMPGVGSTFSVRLPLARQTGVSGGQRQQAAVDEATRTASQLAGR